MRLPSGRPWRLLVTATAALVLAATQSTAAPLAHASGIVTVPDPGSVAAADSDTTRFVALWDSRFRSGPAFQAYLDSDLEHDDGYNDATDERQAALVAALIRHWRATDSGFAAFVDWEAEDTTPGGDRPTAYDVAVIVDSIIFHKEEFKAALRQDDEGASTGTPDGDVQTEPTPADPLGEQATAALAEATVTANKPPALAALDKLSDADALTGRVVETVPVDAVDRLPTTGDVAGVDLGELADTLAPLLAPLAALATSVTPPSVGAYAPAVIGPQNLTYTVCWQRPAAAPVCPTTPYVVGLVALPGTAALVDVDGNASTDLEIALTIDPISTPGGLAATVSVKAHSPAGTAARAFVRYAMPDSDKEVRVGFNGLTTGGLQPTQTAKVVFENIAGMSTGESRLNASVSHSGGGGVKTVALETSYSGGATPDSLAAVTTFVRAPSVFTGRLVLKRTTGSQLTQVEAGHGGGVLPDVTVDAVARLGAAHVTGHVALTRVPTSTSVTATSDDATKETRVTYTSTSSLTALNAAVAVVPDVASPGAFSVAALSLANIPTQVTITVAADRLSYTANTNGGALQASLDQYTGSLLAKRAYVGLSSVPASASATLAPSAQRFVVDSGTTGIATVTAGYLDKSKALNVSLAIAGFPGHAELTMPSSADPRLAWTASAATTSLLVNATYGAWTAYLNVTSVPRSMSIVPGTANVDVTTSGGTAASVTAWLTNHNAHVESPHAGDNWVTATRKKFVVPLAGQYSMTVTLVSAAVRIQNIVTLRVTPGADPSLDLEAGGGAPLYAKYLNEDLVAKRIGLVEARLVSFPGKVTATFGTTTKVTASANTDLTAYAESGPITTGLAAVPNPHGVAVRRQLVNGVPLVRARVWLTGLPTSVELSPGRAVLSGIRPTQSSITVDIVNDDPANPVSAYAALTGIPVNNAHGISVSWNTSQIAGGYETVLDASTGGATFGALRVVVEYGRYKAQFDTSALPSSMRATMTELEGLTKVEWNASAPISSVDVQVAARPSPTSSWTARGRVTLTDIPSWFTLTTGRDGGGAGPVVSYETNPGSPQLDVTVTADGSMKTSNTKVNANLYFAITNLAQRVEIAKAGSGFALTGIGRTGSIAAKVSASASYSKKDKSSTSSSWVSFPWEYEITASAVLDNLNVTLDNVAAFTVKPGIPVELTGDYGRFELRWDSFKVDIRAGGTLFMHVNIGIWSGSFEIVKAQLNTQWGIDPTVRIYEPGWQNVLNVAMWVPCWNFGFRADIQPKPLWSARFTSGIVLTGSPGSTRTKWVTPVAFGWDRLSDVVTGISLYGGGFVNGSFWKTKLCDIWNPFSWF